MGIAEAGTSAGTAIESGNSTSLCSLSAAFVGGSVGSSDPAAAAAFPEPSPVGPAPSLEEAASPLLSPSPSLRKVYKRREAVIQEKRRDNESDCTW